MLTFMILRLVYGLYIIVGLLIIYRTLSLVIFHRETRNPKFFAKGIGFALIWPLAIFSANGRKQLVAAIPFMGRIERKD